MAAPEIGDWAAARAALRQAMSDGEVEDVEDIFAFLDDYARRERAADDQN